MCVLLQKQDSLVKSLSHESLYSKLLQPLRYNHKESFIQSQTDPEKRKWLTSGSQKKRVFTGLNPLETTLKS